MRKGCAEYNLSRWRGDETLTACYLVYCLLRSNQPMTSYNLKPIIPPSLLAQQKKEEHRRVLEAVRARRRENYKRFRERMSGIVPEQPETAG